MTYNKPETWSESFIDWHVKFIEKHCKIGKHLEQGCIHCAKKKGWLFSVRTDGADLD